jgi:hypothetical protein
VLARVDTGGEAALSVFMTGRCERAAFSVISTAFVAQSLISDTGASIYQRLLAKGVSQNATPCLHKFY